jgi:ubiquitin-protein ligase
MSKHIKKLLKDIEDLKSTPLDNIKIGVKEDNIKNCYCLIYGLTEEEYLEGEYIFNIKLHENHPFEPPNFYFLTPSGLFEINKKLCFSNSSLHPESWSPMWNLRTIILGLFSFFLEKKTTGVGHLYTPIETKKKYAIESKEYNTNKLNEILELFK